MFKSTFRSLAALLITAVFAANASAAVVTIEIAMQYTGDQPDGYLVLEFSDEAVGLEAGEVKMTLTGFLEGNEDLDTLGFNFDAGDDTEDILSDLLFSNEMTTGGFSGVAGIDTALDGLQGNLGPQGGFDVLFDFPEGNPAGRFNSTDTVMFIISSEQIDLTASMFDSANSAGVKAAAHIRNTDGQAGSGKIKDGGTPEIPAPAALPAGLALLGLAVARRRRAA